MNTSAEYDKAIRDLISTMPFAIRVAVGQVSFFGTIITQYAWIPNGGNPASVQTLVDAGEGVYDATTFRLGIRWVTADELATLRDLIANRDNLASQGK